MYHKLEAVKWSEKKNKNIQFGSKIIGVSTLKKKATFYKLSNW